MDADADSYSGTTERRAERADRRQTFWRALAYGGMHPRRRDGRRTGDLHRPLIDWHAPELLLSALTVLVLCTVDAFLTLRLLSVGAIEANPVMALLVYGDARGFAVTKLAMTGFGVLALVAVARFRVFRFMRVSVLLHLISIGYLALIFYELSLLSANG